MTYSKYLLPWGKSFPNFLFDYQCHSRKSITGVCCFSIYKEYGKWFCLSYPIYKYDTIEEAMAETDCRIKKDGYFLIESHERAEKLRPLL